MIRSPMFILSIIVWRTVCWMESSLKPSALTHFGTLSKFLFLSRSQFPHLFLFFKALLILIVTIYGSFSLDQKTLPLIGKEQSLLKKSISTICTTEYHLDHITDTG